MRTRHLVLSGLKHYRGTHAMVVAGVAVAVAVLAGALLVGASVRESLREIALARLGNTDLVLSSTTFFREALAEEAATAKAEALTILDAAPVIALTGALVHEDSGRIAARVQVFGIDERFVRFHALGGAAPTGREAWVGADLAEEIGAAAGDSLLLRIAKPTDIPLSTLQGRREDAGERIRFTVARVTDRRALGEFSLVPSQGPALTLFVPLDRLQRDLDLEGRVNTVLLRGPGVTLGRDAFAREIGRLIVPLVTAEDLGLTMRVDEQRDRFIVEGASGLLPPAVVDAAITAARDTGRTATPALTYLANAIRIGDRAIPYSIVTAMDLSGTDVAPAEARTPPTHPPLWLSEWAAQDLHARAGDAVTLEYYLWSDEAGLRTDSATFTFAGTVPMDGPGGDPTLTPEYPGLTNAVDISGWDPPFPVDLTRVRKADEEYWDRWRTAPKAFITLATGQRLWPSPFGNVSSVRTPRAIQPTQAAPLSASTVAPWAFLTRVDPFASGLALRDARAEALAAAEGTTDFGEYFIYFSFFLVVAGLLLSALFFALGVEQRVREIGVLRAVGFAPRTVRSMLLAEAAVLAIAGSIIGAAGAIAYAALIMYGLRTWWVGAVGTTALRLHIDALLLAAGVAGALAAALVALVLSFRRVARRTPRSLLTGVADEETRVGSRQSAVGSRASAVGRRTWEVGGRASEVGGRPSAVGLTRSLAIAVVASAVAIALVTASVIGLLNQAAGFFGAGGLLMIAGLSLFAWWLQRGLVWFSGTTPSKTTPGLVSFGANYARWRPTRSVLSASLITFACFVLVAVGAFRRDLAGSSLDRASGTGGFVLMGESVAPLMHNPNTAAGREDLALPPDTPADRMRVARFRLRPGDEVSCLTLYRPQNPRIVAPEDAFLRENRFSFAGSVASTPEERQNPWLLLQRRFDDGAIPAIVDQTSLMYVFHLKLGDDFVFAAEGAPEVRLRIVGALADSVLQSEIVIGEEAFTTLFPRQEGYRVWMIEAPAEEAAALSTFLEDRLADFGFDVTETRARLAAYHRIENTYLSTFQALGGLGLLVGTIGLAAVLARNVLERRRELGLLGAIGFTPSHLRVIVVSESALLVGTGVTLGTLAALVAVFPALVDRGELLPFGSLLLLLLGVVATALLSSIAAAHVATSTPVVAALKAE